MIYLHKILPLIFSPLNFILVLIVSGLIFQSKKIIYIAIFILVIISSPIISHKLTSYLEIDYQLKQVSEVDTANAIVVLSGMVVTIQTKDVLAYELGDAADRIFAGIDLFKENKAPSLILTGGKMPWSVGKPEGEFLRDLAIKFGVEKKNILLTENVENTDQEAKSIKKILTIDNPKVILVTSAFHMRRAQNIFEAAGIKVIPFPVDFRSGATQLTIMDFIPSSLSLTKTSFFFREMIGRAYYNLKY